MARKAPPSRRKAGAAAAAPGRLNAMVRMLAEALSQGAPPDLLEPLVDRLLAAGLTGQVAKGLLDIADAPAEDEDAAAHALVLSVLLDELRLRAHGGDSAAGREIEALRGSVAVALDAGQASPIAVMLLGQAMARAQVDPGPRLREALADAALAAGADGTAPASAAPDLAALAESLGQDPFAIAEELGTLLAIVPAAQRLPVILGFARAGEAAIREAALGLALGLPDEQAGEVLAALAEAPEVSAALPDRLVRLRPWLREALRPRLDATLRVLRPRAAGAKAAPRVEIRAVLSSLTDGAGAQSVFVALRRGRDHALISFLMKQGVGIADAITHAGLPAAELRAMTARLAEALELLEVPLDFLEFRLGAALGETLAAGAAPPFALLEAAEYLALAPITPAPVSTAALLDRLLGRLPAEQTDMAALAAAQARLPRLLPQTQESWFEAGDEVEALLRPLRGRAKREQALLERWLPARRGIWAGRLAWTAAALKAAEEEAQDWIDLALVARDLAGAAPLAGMPVMRAVAARSVGSRR